MGKRKQLEERFWEKVDKSNPNGCWIWKASKDEKAYGRIKMPGRSGLLRKAHAVCWELIFGEIPVGLEVCHHCDNPSCVNPSHLFLGTHKENMRDSFLKGRAYAPKISVKDVLEIRRRYIEDKDKLQRELASEYGLTQGQISRIIRSESWSMVNIGGTKNQ